MIEAFLVLIKSKREMKIVKYIFVISLIAFSLGGCKYDFIVPEEIPIIDPDDPNAVQVSFATDIQPIFNSKCIFCHDTGGQSPDLTEGNSYSSLNSGNFIDTGNPSGSPLYQKPNPDAGGSHQKYTPVEAALVLAWIQQGAKNN